MDTPDTLELARRDREAQGPWEAEYSYGGEADLHLHHANCTKNPGHKNFIPVDKFSIEDLPERYRYNDMVEYIKAVSDLIVRVTVEHVSERRPDTDDRSGKPYINSQNRGQRKKTVGTGWVERVTIWNDEMDQTCMCYDCRKSSTPQRKYATIIICTAVHVIYDESEAKDKTCHLFFDRGGKPETCKDVVALTRMDCWHTDALSDYCEMDYYTHDLQLAERLEKRCQDRDNLQDKIRTKLPKLSFFKYRQPTLDKQPLLFIVSHPHGCSKQISIGRWTSTREDLIGNCCTYNAATCPGSSGAPVYLPLQFRTYDKMGPAHRGVFHKLPGMNFSYLFPVPELIRSAYLDLPKDDAGPYEEKFACGEEEDLHKQYDACQKNPGHQNFFPVDKFSMDILPPFYRQDNIMEVIKCASGLTVRVSVKFVSEGRPETVPGTDNPYPCHSNRGSNQLRVGSGWVTKIERFDDDVCQCEECQISDTPKQGYALVYVKTAAHLVYDELEAKHTTCHLYYDSGEAPDNCKSIIVLKNMCYVKTDGGTCELMYKTHDLDLAEKLKCFRRSFNSCLSIYLTRRTENGTSKVTLAPPLDIVVSHPHGRAKHISMGYYGSHGNTDTENIQCLHNSITCPGSIGAPVITLGREYLYPTFA